MKKLILLLNLCLVSTFFIQAQTPPQAFNYSAVARNSSGQPIASSTIGIQISILKTTLTGSSVYTENHSLSTDAYGLFNLVIGAGSVQSGNMSSIDWSSDKYFLKIGMDATGGTTFVTMGTTQLLSVPYAIHAKTAESLVGGNTGGTGFNHYVGEYFGGGVVFSVWKDTLGVEHGLIVDIDDLAPSGTQWSNLTSTFVNAGSQWDGLSNSTTITGASGHTSSAASLCLNSTNGGQTDWYLPSSQEMNLLFNNYYFVRKAISNISGAVGLDLNNEYWTSTESNTIIARSIYFGSGELRTAEKNQPRFVRAIRVF
jgi:hypothetical protein